MILVIGATGHVGRAVVAGLVDQGQQVRALSRRPEEAGLPAAVEVFQGSASHAGSLGPALRGVEKAFVVLAGDIDGQARGFATAAKTGTLRHVVLLSSSAVLHPVKHAIGDAHRRAEEALRSLGIAWTFLRPGPFHTNSLWWAQSIREKGLARCLIGNNLGAPVDPDDIAAVAVAALTGEGHEYQAYELTGGERLTSEDQVRVLSEVLGKKIQFVVATKAEAVDAFTALSGNRETAITNINALHSPKVPWSSPVGTVREITGRAPCTYREWALANAGLFR